MRQVLLPLLFCCVAAVQPINSFLGTQSIYGPSWKHYNFTSLDVLAEQTQRVLQLGGHQMKLRLAPITTCSGYRLAGDCGGASDLTALSKVPEVAATLGAPNIQWYQMWVYSFSNQNFLSKDWTPAMVQAEYQEVYQWATHMLTTYSGTGKTFLAGNWEGDWALLGASGCKTSSGAYNKTCDPTPQVLERMVQWGAARQRAITDARANVLGGGLASNVSIAYYMEMNLGPQALGGT
jgi:hypothetical protein